MNLVETYLIEVHKTKAYIDKWTSSIKENFIEVTATWNCYGIVEKRTDVFEVERWNKIKEKGYYLG